MAFTMDKQSWLLKLQLIRGTAPLESTSEKWKEINIISKPYKRVPFVIGSSKNADFRIYDKHISSRHAHFICLLGAWYVSTKSTLGLILNGCKLERDSPAALKDGDELQFSASGHLTYKVVIPSVGIPAENQPHGLRCDTATFGQFLQEDTKPFVFGEALEKEDCSTKMKDLDTQGGQGSTGVQWKLVDTEDHLKIKLKAECVSETRHIKKSKEKRAKMMANWQELMSNNDQAMTDLELEVGTSSDSGFLMKETSFAEVECEHLLGPGPKVVDEITSNVLQQPLEEDQPRIEMHEKQNSGDRLAEMAKEVEDAKTAQAKAEQRLKEKDEEMKRELAAQKEKMEMEFRAKEAEIEMQSQNEIFNLHMAKVKSETSLQEQLKVVTDNANQIIAQCNKEEAALKIQLNAAKHKKRKYEHLLSVAESTKNKIIKKFEGILESELQCSVCTELFVQATTLNCSHTFCKACISDWWTRNKECPICRTGITVGTRTLVLDNFVAKVTEFLSTEKKTERAPSEKKTRTTEKIDTRQATLAWVATQPQQGPVAETTVEL